MYIFGSIHRHIIPLWREVPKNARKAFRTSKKVYFEIDLTNPEDLTSIANCRYFSDKRTLKDLLPLELFNRISNYLSSFQSHLHHSLKKQSSLTLKGLNADKIFHDMTRYWQYQRPIWLIMLLASLRLENVISRFTPSLDSVFFLKSYAMKKDIGYLEKPEQHCGLNNVNSSQVHLFLKHFMPSYCDCELAIKETG